jgi:hypothetical protein
MRAGGSSGIVILNLAYPSMGKERDLFIIWTVKGDIQRTVKIEIYLGKMKKCLK